MYTHDIVRHHSAQLHIIQIKQEHYYQNIFLVAFIFYLSFFLLFYITVS